MPLFERHNYEFPPGTQRDIKCAAQWPREPRRYQAVERYTLWTAPQVRRAVSSRRK
jgi:hypothetical protein